MDWSKINRNVCTTHTYISIYVTIEVGCSNLDFVFEDLVHIKKPPVKSLS